mmetsp:Transcript_24549/g.48992  ORF Transcript_24549/g.48992 Transcript_24549/m.48992 type:complete len:184 (+) Transcript_24549:81-632(+)
MPVNAETQKALMGVVENLGTAKFGLGESETVGVQEIINDNSDNPSYVLLDARSEEERNVSMIAGAITKDDFLVNPDKYKDSTVVCYCTVGYISGACTLELRNQGHLNVKNMGDGALLGYTLHKTSAGVSKPLVKADGSATNDVHTFMDDLAPLAGEGMVGKSFADPPAVLEAANAAIKEKLGV